MTIRDVADYCGVSVSTVSRVLNNKPDVSKAVRTKVMDAVAALHYVPNNSARDLVMTSSDAVGVIVRGAGNPFYTSIIHAIEENLNSSGYTMIISQIPAGANELETGAALARSKRLQGLIFLGGRFDYTASSVAALGVPFVCCTFKNSFGDLKEDSYSSVSIDDCEEAARAVSLLIEKGHRKIGIILDKKDDRSIAQLRYMGYVNALTKAGIDPDDSLVEEVNDYEMDAAYQGALRLLKRCGDLTAIFVIADSLAIAAMKAINDMGKKIPDDCSVISIDGIDMSLYTVPTLTTLIQPKEIMGTRAAQLLVNIIEGRGVNEHLRLAAQLQSGGTVSEITRI